MSTSIGSLLFLSASTSSHSGRRSSIAIPIPQTLAKRCLKGTCIRNEPGEQFQRIFGKTGAIVRRGAVPVVAVQEPALNRVGIGQTLFGGMTQDVFIVRLSTSLGLPVNSLRALRRSFQPVSRVSSKPFTTAFRKISCLYYRVRNCGEA